MEASLALPRTELQQFLHIHPFFNVHPFSLYNTVKNKKKIGKYLLDFLK
jgi:hypothetical protein